MLPTTKYKRNSGFVINSKVILFKQNLVINGKLEHLNSTTTLIYNVMVYKEPWQFLK